MKDKGEDKSLTWVCPRCGTVYCGWSKEKKCEKCGYKEEVEPINNNNRGLTRDRDAD